MLQSIINSDCKVAKEIIAVNPSKGMIGGGLLVSEMGIRAQNLGFADGEKTFCRVGSDWRLEHRLSILKGREQKVRKVLVDRQYEADDLQKKKNIPPDRIMKLELKIAKAKKIVVKLEELIELTRIRIRWDENAILTVKGTIDPNCEIAIGGRIVPVQKSLREVMITAVRYRDSYVNSLIYIEQFKKSRQIDSEAS